MRKSNANIVNKLQVVSMTLQPGEELIVGRRIREVLNKARKAGRKIDGPLNQRFEKLPRNFAAAKIDARCVRLRCRQTSLRLLPDHFSNKGTSMTCTRNSLFWHGLWRSALSPAPPARNGVAPGRAQCHLAHRLGRHRAAGLHHLLHQRHAGRPDESQRPGRHPAAGATPPSRPLTRSTKLEATLKQLGLTFGDVVKATVFLVADPTNGNKINFPAMNAEWSKRFGTAAQPNKPARSTVQVGLATAGALVEIEMVAVKK